MAVGLALGVAACAESDNSAANPFEDEATEPAPTEPPEEKSTSSGEEQGESDATNDPEPEAEPRTVLGWTRQATSLDPRVAGHRPLMAATEAAIYVVDPSHFYGPSVLRSDDGIAWAAVDTPTVDDVTASWSDSYHQGYRRAALAADGETLYVAEVIPESDQPSAVRIWRSDSDGDWSLTELPPLEPPVGAPVQNFHQSVSLAASPDVLVVARTATSSIVWEELVPEEAVLDWLAEQEDPPPRYSRLVAQDDGLALASGHNFYGPIPWEELPPEALAAYVFWTDNRHNYVITADGDVTKVDRPPDYHRDVRWSGTRFFASRWTGSTLEVTNAVSFSTDGRTWSDPVDLPAPTSPGEVIMLGDTLVAVNDTQSGLLRSSDFGVTIEPVELDLPDVEGATVDEPAWIIVPDSLSLQRGALTAIAWRATPPPDGGKEGWGADGREGEWVLSSTDGVTWTATQNQLQPPDRNQWPVFSMVNAAGEIVILREDATIDTRTPDTN